MIESLTRDSSSCQVVFDLYEECMTESAPRYGARTCDLYNQMRESCSKFKRDPHRRSSVEIHKQWEQKTLRKANAAGFATLDEYFRQQHEKDPVMCRLIFEQYKECIRENPDNKAKCDRYRNKCKQFKS